MKKLISLLLSALLVFGSFSVVTAAELAGFTDTAAEETVQEPVITEDFAAMKAVGIFDESILPGATITRRQLAEMYVNIVLPDQSDDEYIPTAIYFDDLLESDFDINIVYELGIMGGAGDNKFLPDKEVTYAEFIKTLINFLGYKTQAENYGGFPTGYMIMSMNLGLDKYAPKDMGLLCTTDLIASLMRQAMGVKVNERVYKSDKDSSWFEKIDISYLELYKKIYTAQGVVTGTYVEDVATQAETRYYDVKIDNKPYILSDDVVSLNELLGYQVIYFYEHDKYDNKVIIHYEVSDTEVLEISRNDIDEQTTTDMIYYYNEDNKLKKVSIEDANVFYNGKLCTSYSVKDINPFVTGDIDGFIRLLSIDSDKDTAEYVFVEAFNSYTVSTMENGEIMNEYNPGVIFDIDDFDEKDIVLKNVKGKLIQSSEIKPDNTLDVFRNQAGEIVKAILVIDTYSGNIERVNRENDVITSIVMDGFEFKAAANLILNEEYNSIKIGKYAKVVFNHLGQISDVMIGLFDSSVKYGYIVDAAYTAGMDGEPCIRMLTSKNTLDTILLNKTLLFTGMKDGIYVEKIKISREEFLDILGTPVNRQVCQYILSATNKLSEIMFVNPELKDNTKDGFYQFDTSGWPATYYRTPAYSFYGKLLVKPGTVIFVVPNEDARYDDSLYYAGGPGLFASYSSQSTTGMAENTTFLDNFRAYGFEANNPVAQVATIEIANSQYFDKKTTSTFLITDKNSEYVDGDVKHTLTGYISGTLYTYEVADEAFNSNTETVTANDPTCKNPQQFDIGDIVRITRSRNDIVTSIQLVFDMSAWEFGSGYTTNPTKSSYTTSLRFFKGKVSYLDDYSVTFEIPPAGLGSPIYESYVHSGVRTFLYDTDARNGVTFGRVKTSPLRWSEIHGKSSDAFVYTESGSVYWLIVRNDR